MSEMMDILWIDWNEDGCIDPGDIAISLSMGEETEGEEEEDDI